MDSATHGAGVGQARQTSSAVGGRPPEHRVELGVQPRFDLGMAREQDPRPGERVGGGLVAGQEQRDHLVAQLPIGHPAAALGVLGVEQHREQVAAVVARRAGGRR